MKLYRLSSALNYIDSNGDLVISDLSVFTQDVLRKINDIIVRKGHNMRGADDCKQAILKFIDIGKGNILKDIYPRWVETISFVLNISKQKIEVNKDYRSKITSLVTKNLGYTSNINNAGFIMQDGRLVNLSSGGMYRDLDHREVSSIVSDVIGGDLSTSDYLEQFMKITGAIRISLTGAKFVAELFHAPTSSQLKWIKDALIQTDGESYIDCVNVNEGIKNISSDKGTNIASILGKIRSYMS